jgi:hypothetical protein
MQGNIFKPKHLTIFIVVMTLLSLLGGYQLSQLIYRMDGDYLQRTDMTMAIERNLGDATTALGRQIQEWKDMLLRASDTELYNKHKKAFFDAGSKVQEALMRTKNAMRDNGMDTSEIEQVLIEHQALSSDYLFANSVLNPREKNSYLEADKLIIGMDRSLQQHIAKVKTDIEKFTELQLKETISTQKKRNLFGLAGALSLLVMSLLGYFFGNRSKGNQTNMPDDLSS